MIATTLVLTHCVLAAFCAVITQYILGLGAPTNPAEVFFSLYLALAVPPLVLAFIASENNWD